LGNGPEANIHTTLKIDSLVSWAKTSEKGKIYPDRKGENQGPEKVAGRKIGKATARN
jgi:hypothetical protein